MKQAIDGSVRSGARGLGHHQRRHGWQQKVVLGKGHHVHGDVIEVHVERAFKAHAAGQVEDDVGCYVIHSVVRLLACSQLFS